VSAVTPSVDIVLVSPRNPLNIGAVARAMAHFGFDDLIVVDPFEPHWQEARSAVGAGAILRNAKRTESLAEAVAACTLVIGTGTVTHRKPEQPVVPLGEIAPILQQERTRGGRIALVFGPEKHGLTREDLSRCQLFVEIPTNPRQPSMNLGQAAAVCLYELAARALPYPWIADRRRSPHDTGFSPYDIAPEPDQAPAPFAPAAPSGSLDLLAAVIEQTMEAAGYSPASMRSANSHDLRLLLRRLAPGTRDTRRILGLFRRILWRLQSRAVKT
jgi:TrmH family RNA methyltransferase